MMFNSRERQCSLKTMAFCAQMTGSDLSLNPTSENRRNSELNDTKAFLHSQFSVDCCVCEQGSHRKTHVDSFQMGIGRITDHFQFGPYFCGVCNFDQHYYE